ncbi:FkbM family methyltransferase [Psychroserpens jangbogonensis]|uniref:FkbM family methyltransferase n=1 Tax=Psychroserpens jangbogonensis TaxID=1484460 RepID=UPI0013792CC8|nr:FkbM family methyltransferase [Psychroserpens jangbogonensis]
MIVYRKIKQRKKMFAKHPVTKNHRNKALFRYVVFNFKNRITKNITYKWVGGLKFYASKGDGGIVGNIYFGLYEFYESIFLIHFLREEDTFLDVGANIGHYALLASGVSKCNTIAIEPVPSTFKRLNDQIELNKLSNKIETLNIGVADKSDYLFFSTDKTTMNKVVDETYKEAVKVQVKAIDSLDGSETFNLMKIDVEGFEKFVLNGSSSTLKSDSLKAIIIEINFSNQFYGVENVEILDILLSYNFHPYRYDPIHRELIKLESYNKEQFNTIFIKNYDFVMNRINDSKKIKVWNTYF